MEEKWCWQGENCNAKNKNKTKSVLMIINKTYINKFITIFLISLEFYAHRYERGEIDWRSYVKQSPNADPYFFHKRLQQRNPVT